MNVIALCCFKARHDHVENVVRCFLNQNYTGESILVLYNNSQTEQKLGDIDLPSNKKIILVNQYLNSKGERYKTLGEIFQDAILWIDNNIDKNWLREALITNSHSDDIYLTHHFSLGVEGYYEGVAKGFNAYKPRKSYFLDGNNVSLVENTLEPSIFIHYPAFKELGYDTKESVKYDSPWLSGIKLYTNEIEKPSLIYCWGNGAYKISGDGDNPDNFENARKAENNEGDGIITPAPEERVQLIYNKILK